MARTTAAEVKEIIETSKSDTVINRFINSANLLITTTFSGDTTISDAQLEDLECWLAAHFIACTVDQQVQSEGAGDASVSYQGKTGMGLDATFYGQQVKILDVTGKLAQVVGKQAVMVYSIPSVAV